MKRRIEPMFFSQKSDKRGLKKKKYLQSIFIFPAIIVILRNILAKLLRIFFIYSTHLRCLRLDQFQEV